MARVEIPVIVLSEASPTSPIAGASVTVKKRGGVAAIVYSDSGATNNEVSQPLTTDSLGRLTGWLNRGAYELSITLPGKSAYVEYLDAAPASDGSIEAAWIENATITLAKMAAAAKDQAAGTASLRSLGSTSITAAAGNDSRLSDTRTPTDGSVSTAKIVDGAITAAKFAAGSGFVPTGSILAFAGSSAPTGFLLCNGESKAKASFEALWAIIEYKYGGASANFNLPDLRGRAGIGPDASAGRVSTNNTLAATGGLQAIALIAANLPAHTHNFSGSTGTESAQHNHNANLGREGTGGFFMLKSGEGGGGMSANQQAHTHGYSGTTDGGNGLSGTGHANLPPYLVLNYIIKT